MTLPATLWHAGGVWTHLREPLTLLDEPVPTSFLVLDVSSASPEQYVFALAEFGRVEGYGETGRLEELLRKTSFDAARTGNPLVVVLPFPQRPGKRRRALQTRVREIIAKQKSEAHKRQVTIPRVLTLQVSQVHSALFGAARVPQVADRELEHARDTVAVPKGSNKFSRVICVADLIGKTELAKAATPPSFLERFAAQFAGAG